MQTLKESIDCNLSNFNIFTHTFVGVQVHEFFMPLQEQWFNKILNTTPSCVSNIDQIMIKTLLAYLHHHHYGQHVSCSIVFMDSGENSPWESSALPWTATSLTSSTLQDKIECTNVPYQTISSALPWTATPASYHQHCQTKLNVLNKVVSFEQCSYTISYKQKNINQYH